MDGLSFFHHDWELACDNTRTCRAAGYHEEAPEPQGRKPLPVSLLLTRKAGPNTPVSGQVYLGDMGDEDGPALNESHPALTLTLQVNGKSQGAVKVPADQSRADLSPPQVQAILGAMSKPSRIEWSMGAYRWRVSDRGATAVLLKMDEFQGRLDTPGAVVRKGDKPESSVLPAVPMPVVYAVPEASAQPLDRQFLKRHGQALLKALRKSQKSADESCELLDPPRGEPEPNPEEWEVVRLSRSDLLVSLPCWRAAYNQGSAYVVVKDRAPFAPVWVTSSGSEYSEGTITATQKGRGMADCLSEDTWIWNGQAFVLMSKSTTGMCRMVTGGGPWVLPTWVTEVKPPR